MDKFMGRPYVICSLLIKDEADKYLLRVLNNMRQLTDNFLILDNASKDNSLEICTQFASKTKAKITMISDDTDFKIDEYHLRTRQFEETIKLNPIWYLAVDADEEFDEYSINEIRYIINTYTSNAFKNNSYPLYCYRFNWPQLWGSEDMIRVDKLWRPCLREVLFRYENGIHYRYRQKKFGCGHAPVSIFEDGLYHIMDRPDIVLKHLSYSKQENINRKYEWYNSQDPEGKFHLKSHLESIGDKDVALMSLDEWINNIRHNK